MSATEGRFRPLCPVCSERSRCRSSPDQFTTCILEMSATKAWWAYGHARLRVEIARGKQINSGVILICIRTAPYLSAWRRHACRSEI